MRNRLGPHDARTKEAGTPLIDFYENVGKKDKAAEVRADLELTK